ncbi:ferritin-like fold-containing protein [Nocardiopsis xinjiangensis]|uniref:ferritin-like fold-containing protein n=1 Tax=Nocardiopsis xinjiangensis TaxID=124285 RepID=UPI00034727EB|nr:ferritin-like fold-containing protein [Nocardiopsis xinjiangensis]
MNPGPSADPAVTDLLGLLAYAELGSFFRLADDAALAPTLRDKGRLASLAAEEERRYERLRERLVERGADPEEAMEPFVAPLDAWHARTEPQSWVESLVKTCVGDGIAGDFYRKVAEFADTGTSALVEGVLAEEGRGTLISGMVRAAVHEDPALAGRLSLWARRLVGEALSQAQQVAAARPRLAALLADGGAGESAVDGAGIGDLASVTRLFGSIADRHAERLEAMGLSD